MSTAEGTQRPEVDLPEYVTVLKDAPVGIMVLDTDERLTYANSMAERLFDNPFIEPGKFRCGDFIGCANRQYDPQICGQTPLCPSCPLYRAIRAALANGQGNSDDLAGEALVGRESQPTSMWVQFQAASIRYKDHKHAVLSLVDVTERRLFEAKRDSIHKRLVERNDFIEAILSNLPVGLSVNRIDTGEATYINKSFERIYGWPMEELTDVETFFEKVYPDPVYRKVIRNRILADIQSKDPKNMIWEGIEATGKDGETRIVNARNIPLYEQNLMISTVQDVTETKKLELSLQRAQKMEAIGTLAGGIAHDFNNILFPIVGLSELLMADLPPDSPQYESADEIFKAGKRGSDLVRQILAFGRQTEQEKIPIRIQHILKEALQLLRSTIPASIRIEQDIQNDCGMVMADPTQIHQIAMNLITNAFHAVESNGGRILVSLQETVIGAGVPDMGSLCAGRYVRLSVTDNGHGIDPLAMNKLFDPYFTTKEKGKGTGLGLSVVFGIVKNLGGDIKVSSELSKGSTFIVLLPVIERGESRPPLKAPQDEATGTEHILLVDDEEAVVKLIQKTLERLGYRVSSRTSSVEALAAFQANPEAFDLLITDLTMPNMTGDQLANKVLAIRPQMPVILCTGFSEAMTPEKARAAGIKAFLMKPVVQAEMAAKIREVLDTRSDR